ncbi:hypothetical protein FGB62_24g128 [Gracilaria domingensis]|nr:hypothetical protein FGB62_24g128 [Gracilaria domingensis]
MRTKGAQNGVGGERRGRGWLLVKLFRCSVGDDAHLPRVGRRGGVLNEDGGAMTSRRRVRYTTPTRLLRMKCSQLQEVKGVEGTKAWTSAVTKRHFRLEPCVAVAKRGNLIGTCADLTKIIQSEAMRTGVAPPGGQCSTDEGVCAPWNTLPGACLARRS